MLKSNIMNMNSFVLTAILLTSIAAAATVTGSLPKTAIAQPDNTTSSFQSAASAAAGGGAIVAVGGGNLTNQNYLFSPQNVTINTGQNVTWFAPTEINELHTVTFMLNKALSSDVFEPFSTSNDSSFAVSSPFNTGKALTMQGPDGVKLVAALNAYSWNPTVIKAGTSDGTILNGTTSGNYFYSMTGDEQMINSGILQQQGPSNSDNSTTTGSNSTNQSSQPSSGGPPFPSVSNFTIQFNKAGTYDYFCQFHPWMTGTVSVK